MDEELDSTSRATPRIWSAPACRPPSARRRAAAEFGGVEARKEDCRQAIGLRLLDESSADLRYGVRQLKRSPAVHGRRNCVARAWDWRQHRDLQPGGSGAVEGQPRL